MRFPLVSFALGLCCALALPAQQGKDPGGKPGVIKQDPAHGALPDKAALREAAQAAVQSGDMVKASECFKKITEVDPKDAQAWHMYGYTLHAQGKHAVEFFTQTKVVVERWLGEWERKF